jgi:hypothetical protein
VGGVAGCAIDTCGKSEVELDVRVVRVRLQPLSPLVEGESTLGWLQVDLLDSLAGRACLGVVELGEDHIEGCRLDGIGQTGVGNLALGSGGDEQVLLECLQLVDEVTVVGEDGVVVRDGISGGLEIEVVSVNDNIAKRTGSSPGLSIGSESSGKELSEVLSDFLAGQVVVGGPTSAERKEDLLAVRLALLDARGNTRAV